MKICIELVAGPHGSAPTVAMLDKNIAAQEKALDGATGADRNLLMDTRSILEAIRRQLTSERF